MATTIRAYRGSRPLARTRKRATGAQPQFAVAPRAPQVYPGEQKYLLCPASEHQHPPRALAIYPTTKQAMPAFVCGCGVKGYASTRFSIETMGYTAEVLRERGIPTDVGPLDREPPAGKGARYVICPASYWLHAGIHAVVVQKGPKAYHCRCSCGGNFFLGRHVPPLVPAPWTDRHGYTREQITALGATVDG